MVSIALSPTFQSILGHRVLLWLGDVSLPIYLLHGPLLRSVFMWIAFAGIYPGYKDQLFVTGQSMPVLQPIGNTSPGRVVIALLIWLALTLLLAQLWTHAVEVWCRSMVKSLEDIAIENKELLLRFRAGIEERSLAEARS